jgi:hypothetical protein
LGTTIGCGGEEFQSGTGGASSGGTSNGGTSGTGATGGGGTGGVAGNVNPSGGSGNLGGGAGRGGTGGDIPGCALKPGAPILLHTTLDQGSAIQSPDTGIPPGSSHGEFVPGICPTSARTGAIAISSQGDFVSYSGEQNINLQTGTVDFYFKSTVSSAGATRHLVTVAGKFQISLDVQGNLLVGVGPSVARTIPAANVPFTQNTWVRVTITWKFQATEETVDVYFDGNGADGPYTAGPLNVPPLEQSPLFIGASGENDVNVAQGVFDDLKIYDGTEEP